MLRSGSPARRRGQWSLVGILVALAIVAILAAIYVPRITSRHSQPSQAATPTERGLGVACGEYAAQMNQAVLLYKTDHDDRPPHSLDELKRYGVTDDMIHAEGCSFGMDPATGTVYDTGQGRAQPGAAPVTLAPGGGPAPAAPTAPPNGGTRGPGGVTLPNIPTSGGL